MEQQQQQQRGEYNREEEYLSAQRAGVEALQIGRATLSQVHQQGEQLDRAGTLADETDYKLQKATRVLRGMTWSGWVANMFSRSVGPPPPDDISNNASTGDGRRREPPDVYEGLPPVVQRAAQHVQNYHANVKVLEACDTEEQKETCKLICDDMFKVAIHALDDLYQQQQRYVEAYTLQLAKDLEILRNRQQSSERRIRGLPTIGLTDGTGGTKQDQKHELMSSSTASKTAKKPPGEDDVVALQQEQHLDTIAQALGELGSIAQSLNQSMGHQNETLHHLDTKSENILEKQYMVNRRTERLIQKKSWTPAKPTFHASVSIRHVATGLYLAVGTKGDLFLSKTYHHETCVFGLWKRQGSIFGLKSNHTGKWVGQNLFGMLACSAGSFGRREEWDATNEDWTSTKLICASAGWGNGGYVLVRRKDFALLLGGSHEQDRANAAVWCIKDITSGDEVGR